MPETQWTPSMDLYGELWLKLRQLDWCVKQLRINGSALADAEREYRIRLRAECLALRDEGMPVTLIQQTVRGVPEIADLRHARDYASVILDANRDAIMALKLEIKVINAQIERELGSPSLGYGGV